MQTPFRLLLPVPLRDALFAQARAELPLECVGWLAGRFEETPAGKIGRAERRYPFRNADASPIRFSAEPADMFQAQKDMRQHGLELLAIYHSHPTSEPTPSKTDLARNFWGSDIVNFIISLTNEPPRMRGWWLEADSFREADWELVEA